MTTPLDDAEFIPGEPRLRFFEHMTQRWPNRDTAEDLVAAMHARDIGRTGQPVTVNVTLDGVPGYFTTDLDSGELAYVPVLGPTGEG